MGAFVPAVLDLSCAPLAVLIGLAPIRQDFVDVCLSAVVNVCFVRQNIYTYIYICMHMCVQRGVFHWLVGITPQSESLNSTVPWKLGVRTIRIRMPAGRS